jgi:hypothetical protein
MSIGIPGFSVYFEHHQVKPFIKEKSKKAKDLFDERVVPTVLQGTCTALEFVANNTADAHDYLVGKLKTKKSTCCSDSNLKKESRQ